MFEICSDFSKKGFKIYYFLLYSKNAKKWPNHFISGNRFKKGQMEIMVSIGLCFHQYF